MQKLIYILSLPMMLADWLYGLILKPIDNWWAALSPFTKIYIIMFAILIYLSHRIDKIIKEFYAILPEEQQKKFINNQYRYFGELRWTDYISGCWFGIGIMFLFYYIYKWIIMGLIWLVG